MNSSLVALDAFRKRKMRLRVFLALEALYTEVLERLADERNEIHPEELEEFMLQVLADHLTGSLKSPDEVALLDENYRRFDERLRRCLQTRLRSLKHFQQKGLR
jgi:ABC-type sulfate/molybdate transport systems ATPase subunit